MYRYQTQFPSTSKKTGHRYDRAAMSANAAPTGLRTVWSRPANRALILGWLSLIPLLVWWLGWFPGFMSSDSIDQLGQAARFDFQNFHPITHTFSLWVVTRIWNDAGAITLLQVMLLAGLLGYTARRLNQVGAPWWLASAAASYLAWVKLYSWN